MSATVSRPTPRLVEQFEGGLDAPICLTWELTYACNLACVHCLSSSGRRDPDELATAELCAVVDELQAMQVFYVNIRGGEPIIRADFWDLVGYAEQRRVGVKFSTNGSRITPERARALAAMDYVDVQVSVDGATAEVNDAVRGRGTFELARRAMDNLAEAGGFARVWRHSPLFADLRDPPSGGPCSTCTAFDSCRGGCMAAKFFTGLLLDGPDPECVQGHGAVALTLVDRATAPSPSGDHSRTAAPRHAPVLLGLPTAPDRRNGAP